MKEKLQRLPLGLSDFAKLRENGDLYVDKTGHLLRLLERGDYLFLARPRRFGKSLLCSTMRYLYEGRRELFSGLAIESEWDWSKTNPVVFLSMAEMGSSSVEEFQEDVRITLEKIADRNGIVLTEGSIGNILLSLLEALSLKSGRKVVVIIDEYEKPVHDHIQDLDMAEKMRAVLARYYGALKGCDAFLEKVFITGIGRMVKTSVFSDLNQMTDYTLDEVCAEICGYTEEELAANFRGYIECLAEAKGQNLLSASALLKERYNGYWWGKGEKVYNPWAILNCLSRREYGNFWWGYGTPGVLMNLATQLPEPEGDLEGIEVGELALLVDLSRAEAVSLLWQSGYLTIKENLEGSYVLGFPNGEVRESWYRMLLGHFSGVSQVTGDTAAAVMLSAMERGEEDRFEKGLRTLFAAIPGELQRKEELYFHSVFYAALQAVGGAIIAESRTDKGRVDAVVRTRKRVYVIEFKLGKATEAISQIRKNRYYEPYECEGKELILVGAGGFRERAVEVVWEELRIGN